MPLMTGSDQALHYHNAFAAPLPSGQAENQSYLTHGETESLSQLTSMH